MRLVEEAQRSKSRTQILADRAAGWLFYIAIAVAAATGVAWVIAIGFDVQVIARVATVLVIACPHALGLAIPLVVAITTSLGARAGILVRDRLALEEARLIDTVIFDKTGTLTRGEFGVVGIAVVDGLDESSALALTAAVEADSEHTIARAIRRTAEEKALPVPRAARSSAMAPAAVSTCTAPTPARVSASTMPDRPARRSAWRRSSASAWPGCRSGRWQRARIDCSRLAAWWSAAPIIAPPRDRPQPPQPGSFTKSAGPYTASDPGRPGENDPGCPGEEAG